MDTEDKKVKQGEGLSDADIEAKIIHILGIYPIISPTMLQVSLGAYLKPAKWRPVLARLITEGKVKETQEAMQTPAERYNNYTKLSLPGTEVSVEN